jgi:hypothetical protein
VMSLGSRLRKEMSPFWDILRESRLVSLKIWKSCGLIFSFQKMSGFQMKSCIKNSSWRNK